MCLFPNHMDSYFIYQTRLDQNRSTCNGKAHVHLRIYIMILKSIRSILVETFDPLVSHFKKQTRHWILIINMKLVRID